MGFHSMTPLDGLTVLDFQPRAGGARTARCSSRTSARGSSRSSSPARGDDTRAWGPPFVGGESAYFLSVNRNKESLALDLKHPRGAADPRRAAGARGRASSRTSGRGRWSGWGSATTTVAARHPRLVYCSISGFGQTGPRRAEAGYDAMMQAEGGLMSITGAAGGPPFRARRRDRRHRDRACSRCRGSSRRCFARERERGRGQRVDIAMLDAVTALLTYQASSAFATGETPVRMGNRHPSIAPYDTFAAADGEFVLSVGNDDQFRRLVGRAAAARRSAATRASRPTRIASRTTRRCGQNCRRCWRRGRGRICSRR